jgi:hypothetical protein
MLAQHRRDYFLRWSVNKSTLFTNSFECNYLYALTLGKKPTPLGANIDNGAQTESKSCV